MKLGLLGKELSHSFSINYFSQKFKKDNLTGYSYELFELAGIEELPELLKINPDLKGFNVTIPYKESIIPYLDKLEGAAEEIQAVNTVLIKKENGKTKLIGFNTDAIGFANSVKPFLLNSHERALILGTGGASKAINFTLQNLGIETLFVSRNPNKNQIHYSDINEYVMKYHKLIINCTPLGTFPNVEECPDLPYKLINSSHTLIDLIYNPEQTLFLKKGKLEGAVTLNGLSMLQLQAEESWKIWVGK